MSAASPVVDLNRLKLKLYAEFSDWQDFVTALNEFEKQTSIKFTITTSRKMKPTSVSPKVSRGKSKQSSQKPFEYKYIKLTCKHYGGYKSTSKGIRPNQKTTKLMCPTYIYGCFDHFKQKFVIKQMVVNCNHELKDEDVLVTKVLKDPTETESVPIDDGSDSPKKYVKIRNRNVLKVPIQSPNMTTYMHVNQIRIRCNHEVNDTCEASTLTTEDLHSIHESFSSKSVEEQNKLMIEWVHVMPFDTSEKTVQVLFHLPAFDGSLIKVCLKAFSQVLRVSLNRIYDLINEHFDENGSLIEPSDTTVANPMDYSCEKEETDVESRECVIWNNLKPPVIKLSPVERGFMLEVDCEFNIDLKAVDVEDNKKTLKVCFTSNNKA